MEKLKVFDEFYLDKEKDVIVKLYRISKDEIEYILETPNHKKGTLITNLAQICHLETEKNENDKYILSGTFAKYPIEVNDIKNNSDLAKMKKFILLDLEE